MRRLIALLLPLLCLALAVTPAQADDAEPPLPVTYNFLGGAIAQGLDPAPSAPGSNDWDCTPSAAHPRPVILVHGTLGAQDTNWPTYAPLLKNHGYCVFALTYGDTFPGMEGRFGGLGKIQASAKEFGAFVARVRRATGAAKIDLIGHSQGTLMPNYYAKFLGGARHIKHYISLAPLWHGTDSSGTVQLSRKVFGAPTDLPMCDACGQMRTGSRFMKKMRSAGVAQAGITYTNIVTEHDQLVTPYTSGIERGMRNFVVQDGCAEDQSEHFEIASDPLGARIVLNTLDPAHAKPVECQVVLPYVGPPGG